MLNGSFKYHDKFKLGSALGAQKFTQSSKQYMQEFLIAICLLNMQPKIRDPYDGFDAPPLTTRDLSTSKLQH